MKKYQPVLLFFLLSFIILFVAGFYHWYENSQKMTQVEYISDPDWSVPVPVASELQSQIYQVIPEEDGLTIFWIRKITQTFVEELYVQKINYLGEVIIEPILLKSDQNLKDFGVTKLNNTYHLFIFMGKAEDDLDLLYWNLDASYQLTTEKELTHGLAFTNDVKILNDDTNIYLTWASSVAKYHQIQLAKYDLTTAQFQIKQITTKPIQHTFPNILITDNKINLAYLERDPSITSNLRAVDMGNEYRLVYQQFDLNLTQLRSEVVVGPAALTMGTVAPQMLYKEGSLHIVWGKFFDEIRNVNPGRWLYYTAINPEKAESIHIHRLTPEYGFSFDPTLIQHNDQFKLAFINSRDQDLMLATLDPIELTLTNYSRLFTNQQLGFRPLLFTDPSGDLGITWIEMEDGVMQLYYASTKYPHKPGVLEVLGMKIEESGGFVGTYLWVILLYFFIFPLYRVFLNIDVVLIPVVLSYIALFISHRYKQLTFLKKVNNCYLIYFSALLITVIKMIRGSVYLFDISSLAIPSGFAPLMIGLSFAFSLFFMWRLKFKPRHGLLVGAACFLFWLYLINQANFIFQIHQYTFS